MLIASPLRARIDSSAFRKARARKITPVNKAYRAHFVSSAQGNTTLCLLRDAQATRRAASRCVIIGFYAIFASLSIMRGRALLRCLFHSHVGRFITSTAISFKIVFILIAAVDDILR